MPETRTPYRYALIIDLNLAPVDGKAIRLYLYGDAPRPSLEFTVNIGCLVDLETKPFDTIMREVSWRIEQRPGTDAIYLVGDPNEYDLESLCQEIARSIGVPTSPIATSELAIHE
jgi:hypothetical protein